MFCVGSVVAARLSENPEYKVLLIEAGSDPPIESEIPNLFFELNHVNSTSNWGFYAEKSDVASKSFEKGVHWPRGRMLGGCHGSHFLDSSSHMNIFRYDFLYICLLRH